MISLEPDELYDADDNGLERMRLRAARALSSRIPVKEIVQSKTDFQFSASTEDGDTSWFDDFKAVDVSSEFLEDSNLTGEDLIKKVKTLFELECLVRALDSMETLSSLAEISREYVFLPRFASPSSHIAFNIANVTN